jgi:hypothetical protein
MRPIALGFTVVLALACRAPSNGQPPEGAAASQPHVEERWCEEVDSASACTMYAPSLITLIARPEIFEGKPVRLIGYVHFQFEDNGLYVSRESYDHGISRDGIWIDLPLRIGGDSAPTRQQPNDRYVIVEGIFNAHDQGHLGLWSGALQNVTRLDAWSRAGTPSAYQHP